MKKTYMAPVMESEEFLANEYVATCWNVICRFKKEHQNSSCEFNEQNHTIHGKDFETAVNETGSGFMHKGVPNSRLHKVQTRVLDVALDTKSEDSSQYYHDTSFPTIHHELDYSVNPNAS